MSFPDKTAISRPRSPDLIPGYKLEALVGKGGMGEVHKATQLSLGRMVAVKLLSGELAKDPAFVARFEKEAAALATLSHPHVVSIVDKGRANGTYFLVMEYVDGPSLREVMRSPLLDSATSLKIALEICRAIDYAHSRGVIHRDLKPENILFDEQAGGIPKVSDFGLAGFLEGASQPKFNVTETHVAMGTVSYMAPEQRVDAKTADHRADIYSLGVILYELVVGELPLGNFDPPSHRKPGLDKRLDAIVAKCLKPIPVDRYAKVADLIADLEPLVPVTATMTPRKVGRVERASLVIRRVARNATRVVGALIVTAALVVLLLAALRTRGRPAVDKAPGEAITSATGEPKAVLTIDGRRDASLEHLALSLGAGPDRVSLVAFGRPITFDSGALTFPPAADKGSAVGRAQPDLDEIDGFSVTLKADAATQAPPGGLWTNTRRLISGESPNPSSTLLLMGAPGRFVSLSVFGNGKSSLAWQLGSDKHSDGMGGPKTEPSASLELEVGRDGELRGFVGSGNNRRRVGEPLSLGANWKHYFGGSVPKPALGCIEGTCVFKNFSYTVGRERPSEPPPPPPPPSAAKTSTKPALAQAHNPATLKKGTAVAKRTEGHPGTTTAIHKTLPPKKQQH